MEKTRQSLDTERLKKWLAYKEVGIKMSPECLGLVESEKWALQLIQMTGGQVNQEYVKLLNKLTE